MKKILIIIYRDEDLNFILISFSYANKWHKNMKKQEKKDFANYVLKGNNLIIKWFLIYRN